MYRWLKTAYWFARLHLRIFNMHRQLRGACVHVCEQVGCVCIFPGPTKATPSPWGWWRQRDVEPNQKARVRQRARGIRDSFANYSTFVRCTIHAPLLVEAEKRKEKQQQKRTLQYSDRTHMHGNIINPLWWGVDGDLPNIRDVVP